MLFALYAINKYMHLTGIYTSTLVEYSRLFLTVAQLKNCLFRINIIGPLFIFLIGQSS